MFTEEQESILQNIKSLVSELEQIEEGETAADAIMGSDDDVKKSKVKKEKTSNMNKKRDKRKVRKEEDEELDYVEGEDLEIEDEPSDLDEEEIAKAIDTIKRVLKQGDGDGSTGDDDAEDRLDEDIPEPTKDNVAEVAKAVAIAMKLNKGNPNRKKRVITKSNDLDEVKKALVDLTKVVKTMVVDQKETDQAIEGLLSGLGVVNKMNESRGRNATQNRQVRKSASGRTRGTAPVNDRFVSRKQVGEEVRKAFNEVLKDESKSATVSGTTTTGNPKRREVRKDLADVLPEIFNVGRNQ